MEILKSKSIEDFEVQKTNDNILNPNPYFRRYGSHIKSHFSQSKCEIFGSLDEEITSNVNVIQTDKKSLNSMGSINVRSDFNKPSNVNNSSLHNLDRSHKLVINKSLYGARSVKHVKNKPSIDKTNIPVLPVVSAKKKIDPFDLEFGDDAGQSSSLIIKKSRNPSLDSFKSIDFDVKNLTEPGTDFSLNTGSNQANDFQSGNHDKSLDSTANNSVVKKKTGVKVAKLDEQQKEFKS